MNRGDIGGVGYRDWGHCSALKFEGKKAICEIEQNRGHEAKPDVCQQYPFPDIDNGKCQRELRIANVTK